MTNKEARDYFQEEMIDGKCSDDCIPCNAMVKAYYALDKQIGVIPKQDKRKGDGCYCPVCGKEFFIHSWQRDWVFHTDRKQKICSYSCMQKYHKIRNKKNYIKHGVTG